MFRFLNAVPDADIACKLCMFMILESSQMNQNTTSLIHIGSVSRHFKHVNQKFQYISSQDSTMDFQALGEASSYTKRTPSSSFILFCLPRSGFRI